MHELFCDRWLQNQHPRPEPRWRNPRKPAKTIVHVNTHRIKHNQKNSQKQPVITVKNSNTNNRYCYKVEILGGCRVVYSPNKPICGARVWIESLYEVKLIT
ncbi:MAG: hypothetical protein QNJ60_21800 [Xenococcaceae cyanobacterium MO_188.B19]|nr:hypothetical protein [Xenococcaceae cyanobacterium MO_188.B19]